MDAPKKKAATGPVRAYKGADADMLTTLLVLLDAALAEQPALVQRRSRYTVPFLKALRKETADALEIDLGIDPRSARQEATGQVLTAAAEARHLLADFYQDLRDAYANNKPRLQELRAALGFRDHYATVRDEHQQALGQLLAQFDQAMTPALLAELTDPARGDISASLIADIRAQLAFYELNVTQENLKGTAVIITRELVEKFNALYRKVMQVARLGRSVFRLAPAKAARFSYSHSRRMLRGGQLNAPPTA